MSKKYITNSTKYHDKPCTKCGDTLKYKSGDCVACSLEQSRRWAKENREKSRAIKQRWAKANPGKVRASDHKYRKANPEKECARHRKYQMANPEKYRANSKRWREANPKKAREATRKWREANPDHDSKYQRENLDYYRKASQRRRAIKSKAKSEDYDFEAICAHYGNMCLRCRRTNVKLTIDHVMPLVLGGDDIAQNIQPLCLSCNSSKNARNIDYRPGYQTKLL